MADSLYVRTAQFSHEIVTVFDVPMHQMTNVETGMVEAVLGDDDFAVQYAPISGS